MNLHVSPQRVTDEVLARRDLRLRVGEHVVDVGALQVVTRPELPRLTGKSVAVLIELVRHAGNTVTREMLMERVWPRRFTTPGVLNQAITELRRAFGDDGRPPTYIQTIPKVGYRLLASVQVMETPENALFLVEHPDHRDAANDATAGQAADASPRSLPHRARLWIAAACVAAMLAAAVALLPRANVGHAPADARRWIVSDVRALTSDPGAERRPHISPDGSRIAFVVTEPDNSMGRIVVRTLEPSRLVTLTSARNEDEAVPVWSPDGTRIAYESLDDPDCTMHVASSLGGDVREIGRCHLYFTNYYDWTPDGRGLISADRKADEKRDLRLFVQDLDTGAKRYLDYARDPGDQDLEARYSPDGKRIAFRRGIAPYSDLFLMDADGTQARALTHRAMTIRGFAWTRDGSALVFASGQRLFAVDVDSGRIRDLGISPAEFPDAARATDTIVYEIPRTHSTLSRAAVGGEEPVVPQALTPSTGSDFAPAVSPRGDRIAFVSDRTGQQQVWLYDFGAGAASALTDRADAATTMPNWNRDGSAVLAIEHAEGRSRLIEIDIASRQRRVLSRADEDVLEVAAGAAADVYVWIADVPGGNNELVRVRHPGRPDEQREVLARSVTDLNFDAADNALYFTHRDIGSSLYRVAFDRGEVEPAAAKTPVRVGYWHVVDGEMWYFAQIDEKVAKLRAFDFATGESRALVTLSAIVRNFDFSVMPDHKSIIVTPADHEDTDVGMLRLSRAADHPP